MWKLKGDAKIYVEMERAQNNQNTFKRTKMENLHSLISKSTIKVSDKGNVALAYVNQWNGRESPHRPYMAN